MKIKVIQDFIDSHENDIVRRINDEYETNKERALFLIQREYATKISEEIELKSSKPSADKDTKDDKTKK